MNPTKDEIKIAGSLLRDSSILRDTGWAMNAVDFYTANRILPAMQKVYEAS